MTNEVWLILNFALFLYHCTSRSGAACHAKKGIRAWADAMCRRADGLHAVCSVEASPGRIPVYVDCRDLGNFISGCESQGPILVKHEVKIVVHRLDLSHGMQAWECRVGKYMTFGPSIPVYTCIYTDTRIYGVNTHDD